MNERRASKTVDSFLHLKNQVVTQLWKDTKAYKKNIYEIWLYFTLYKECNNALVWYWPKLSSQAKPTPPSLTTNSFA